VIARRATPTCWIGGVPVGAGHPVVVQSMTNTDTEDAASTAAQAIVLSAAGSELVRVTVNTRKAAEAVPEYIFCGTFRRVAPPSRYEAHCPMEFGLSSALLTGSRLPGRILFPCLHRDGNHSSSSWIAPGVQQSTQKHRTGRPSSLAGTLFYLTLLRVGFALPPLLPATRCALTAPFHPYPAMRGGVFSVALSVGSPLPRVTRHTALWSSDFPRPR
jgi:hypothetical protein